MDGSSFYFCVGLKHLQRLTSVHLHVLISRPRGPRVGGGGGGVWVGEGSVGDLEGLKLPQWYVEVKGVAFCLEKKRPCICE